MRHLAAWARPDAVWVLREDLPRLVHSRQPPRAPVVPPGRVAMVTATLGARPRRRSRSVKLQLGNPALPGVVRMRKHATGRVRRDAHDAGLRAAPVVDDGQDRLVVVIVAPRVGRAGFAIDEPGVQHLSFKLTAAGQPHRFAPRFRLGLVRRHLRRVPSRLPPTSPPVLGRVVRQMPHHICGPHHGIRLLSLPNARNNERHEQHHAHPHASHVHLLAGRGGDSR